MKFSQFLVRIFTPLVWLLFPFRTKHKKEALEAAEGKRCMLCCNHTSFADPVLMLVTFPRPIYFMAKEELFRNKLVGWFLGKVMGAFPVNRGTGDTRAIDTARNILNKGHVLGIFPEGTRSKTGELGRGKSGAALLAAQTGAYVLPICMVPKNRKRVRIFQPTTVVFGQPISPEELHLTEGHPDLRYATRTIMDSIAKLRDQA